MKRTTDLRFDRFHQRLVERSAVAPERVVRVADSEVLVGGLAELRRKAEKARRRQCLTQEDYDLDLGDRLRKKQKETA